MFWRHHTRLTAILIASSFPFFACASSRSSRSSRINNNNNNRGAGTLTPYESVRALDEFGNAKQLEYAENASNRQASLVILLQHLENTYIVSVPNGGDRPAHHRRVTLPRVQRLSMPDWISTSTKNKNNSAFLVCTGLQGDARWLTARVRSYTSRLWSVSHQGTPPTAASLAMAVASLMRLFWGYPTDISIASPTLRGVVSSRDDPWARPMGLQVAVVVLNGSENGSQQSQHPQVFQINPAGNVFLPYPAAQGAGKRTRILCCMGAKHEAVRDAMGRNLSKTNHIDDGGNHNDDEAALERWILQSLSDGLGSMQGRSVYLQILTQDGHLLPERRINL